MPLKPPRLAIWGLMFALCVLGCFNGDKATRRQSEAFRDGLILGMVEDDSDFLAIKVFEQNQEQKIRKRLVKNARKLIGTPYGLGNESSTSTDCSGLIYLVCKMSGVPISRGNTRTMQLWSRTDNPLRGDCPMFDHKGRDRPTHIGLWSEPMNHMIHSGTSTGVIETDFNRWWGKANRYKFSVVIPSL